MKRTSVLVWAWALMLGLSFSTARAQTALFDFEGNEPFVTTTPFSTTDNGITATFRSPIDPNGFVVAPSLFTTLFGNVLLNGVDPAITGDIPLVISFDRPLNAASLSFATISDSIISLEAFSGGSGGTLIDAMQTTGTPPDLFGFPEGTLALATSRPFDTLRITSGSAFFAIDNVRVTAPSAVPEPGAWFSFGVGILLLPRKRHRKPVS